MKFNFRQGIQYSPMTDGHPSFMAYNPANNTITIVVGTYLVRATACYKSFNYLIEERENATNAWGPFDWNPVWGVEPGVDYPLWLYWDINRSTGLVSRGFTPLEPIYSEIAPLNPAFDQHWFDLTNTTMKVWNGNTWREVIRVFAGTFISGTITITEFNLGSQAGLTSPGDQSTWFDHGYILFGADMKGIRYNDTNFVTTATQINTFHGSFSSPIRLELLNSTVLASEPIPAFYAVTHDGLGNVGLANGSDISKRPIGITLAPKNPGDPVDVVTHGIVFNDQWNWLAENGKDIYCGPTGELIQADNNNSESHPRVGAILGPQTILIDIDLYGGVGCECDNEEPEPKGPIGFASIYQYYQNTELLKDNIGMFQGSVIDSENNVICFGAGVHEIDGPWATTVVKYNSLGEILWQKIFKAEDTNETYAELGCVDDDNNIYVLVYINTGSNSDSAIGFLKISPTGDLIFQKELIPGLALSNLGSIKAISDGIILASRIYQTGVPNNKLNWVSKFNFNGDLIWEKYFDGINEIIGFDIDPDDGSMYYTIEKSSTYDMDIFTPKGIVTLVKLSSNGNILWTVDISEVIGPGMSIVSCSSTGVYILLGENGYNIICKINKNDGSLIYINAINTPSSFRAIWAARYYDGSIYFVAESYFDSDFLGNTSVCIISKINDQTGEIVYSRKIEYLNEAYFSFFWYTTSNNSLSINSSGHFSIAGYTDNNGIVVSLRTALENYPYFENNGFIITPLQITLTDSTDDYTLVTSTTTDYTYSTTINELSETWGDATINENSTVFIEPILQEAEGYAKSDLVDTKQIMINGKVGTASEYITGKGWTAFPFKKRTSTNGSQINTHFKYLNPEDSFDDDSAGMIVANGFVSSPKAYIVDGGILQASDTAKTSLLFIDPPTNFNPIIIVFPGVPQIGQTFTIVGRNTHTVALATGDGSTILNPISSITAATSYEWVYLRCNDNSVKWVRLR